MHILIPTLVLTAVGYKLKHVLKYSFLGILPDLFYYTPIHRNFSHSYILLIPICVLIYLASKDKKVTFICSVFLLSHPLMDLGGYTAILYPYPNYFRIYAEITMNQTAFAPQPNFGLEIVPPAQVDWIYTSHALQTSTSIIFILLLSVFIFTNRQKIIKWISDRISI